MVNRYEQQLTQLTHQREWYESKMKYAKSEEEEEFFKRKRDAVSTLIAEIDPANVKYGYI